jgi:hypothetical protein
MQGNFRWENASEEDFNRSITFRHASGCARSAGFAKHTDNRFKRVEFASFAAPPQAQQEHTP